MANLLAMLPADLPAILRRRASARAVENAGRDLAAQARLHAEIDTMVARLSAVARDAVPRAS